MVVQILRLSETDETRLRKVGFIKAIYIYFYSRNWLSFRSWDSPKQTKLIKNEHNLSQKFEKNHAKLLWWRFLRIFQKNIKKRSHNKAEMFLMIFVEHLSPKMALLLRKRFWKSWDDLLASSFHFSDHVFRTFWSERDLSQKMLDLPLVSLISASESGQFTHSGDWKWFIYLLHRLEGGCVEAAISRKSQREEWKWR